MFITNKIHIAAVNLAKNPAGPLAPNKLSLLPLYAPSPIEELFCSRTEIVIITAKTTCKTKNNVVTIKPFEKIEFAIIIKDL